MKIKKVLIIPRLCELSSYTQLAEEYGLGFEYNDFFSPNLLDNKNDIGNIIGAYKQCDGLPDYCTMHGAFLDITVFSDDSMIFKASDYRVEQSLEIAASLGVKGVVFHTNYITDFTSEAYRNNWVKRNAEYWSSKLERYGSLNIYIENMFDDSPELIARLGDAMKDADNFGICFDYAHAKVFGSSVDIKEWSRKLAPYVKHIHINDNDLKSDLHLAVGDGSIAWNEFKMCYEKYFSEATVLIEVNGLDKIRRSLEYLNGL